VRASITLASAIFDIPLTDYHRESKGLLLGSGAGTLMAVMDATTRFRWALDIDQCRGREDALSDWIATLDRNKLVDLIALAGWFSITSPAPIARALNNLRTPVIVYSGAGLAREVFGELPLVDTLEEFLRRVTETERAGPRDEGQGASAREHEPEIALAL
jgi:hypothetical protein